MKSTNRIQENGAAKAANSQSKNSRRHQTPKPAADDKLDIRPCFEEGSGTCRADGVMIMLFDAPADKTLAGVEISRSLLAEVERRAKISGFTLSEFLGHALAVATSHDMTGAFIELESARDQANSLHVLMSKGMQGDEGGQWSDDVHCGIVELISTTQARLGKAIENVRTRVFRPELREAV